MTQDEIILMATASGFNVTSEQATKSFCGFAALVAAHEREACCQQRDTKEYEEMVKRQRQYLNQDGSRKDGVAEYAAPLSAPKQEPIGWTHAADLVDDGYGHIFSVYSSKPAYDDWVPVYAASVSVESEWIETNKALAKEIIEQRNQYLDMLSEAVDLSVKAERESCAKVCEEERCYDQDWNSAVNSCAAAIRARGEK